MAEQNHEYEKVIDYIRNQIKVGNLTINSKLPTERAISEELSISRNSTREALRILEHMGILKSVHGSGNYLTD
ncbi:MAG: winged helix-turn-helix domain-containing protein, partial [Candidatus Pseudoruminococcus sp.]|nr:winged helix-turn-helix domain-containing protein [Candidatus Pseudoruminococcus sp.]